jgi:hypothetical protein
MRRMEGTALCVLMFATRRTRVCAPSRLDTFEVDSIEARMSETVRIPRTDAGYAAP